jgi:membrane protein DedA with SNARE-associated domain
MVLAATVGPRRMRAITVRHSSWIGFGEADLDRAEAWFDRRSSTAVLVCRWVPLIRSLISIPAGFRRMPIGRFTVATLVGSLVWNTVLVTAGGLGGLTARKVVRHRRTAPGATERP